MIDDSKSIIRCTNKIYLDELCKREGCRRPKTVHPLRVKDLLAILEQLGYPMVLKIPDGSFSRGVAKVGDRAELERMVGRNARGQRPDPGAGVHVHRVRLAPRRLRRRAPVRVAST